MDAHIVSESNPLPISMLRQIALAGSLDEISNIPDAVRHHIFWHGMRDKTTNNLLKAMFFFVYETSRYGPQNGFRLCLVHEGYHIATDFRIEGSQEDDIDRLEKTIPPGHMEVVVLGQLSS
ncbi:hypothetical protein G7Z17_g7627 [Cylindrodendrum hubeiense]|uniref:Uncharacterized protein n=1 Tax=Cylindrodendrum hubeiense TaxID=595255 RepID=A0A9P5H8P6_9HYPO|nr:hypothetical protein G7Z17_g7627 [Cylindrodendrum hubeiense]